MSSYNNTLNWPTYSGYGSTNIISTNSTGALPTYGNITINTSGTGALGSTSGLYYTNVTTNAAPTAQLHVKGDAEFEGDIKFKGKSLQELFSKIEDRLAILQPDPKKLEKYEALRKAYEHYKLMEKLIGEE